MHVISVRLFQIAQLAVEIDGDLEIQIALKQIILLIRHIPFQLPKIQTYIVTFVGRHRQNAMNLFAFLHGQSFFQVEYGLLPMRVVLIRR